ncbi:hypothetical protein WIS52_06555 [Pseudonocardia nematodicida]|uniref:Uncharacterized protein n=1 Tax=Pseudonocardia nematodicida TaxID=1206997 RepID=A0ABV1K9S9_9PSEU
MEPPIGDETEGSAGAEPDDLDARAARQRLELLAIHTGLTADAEVSAELVEQVVSMTDEVLDLEHSAADHREELAHRRSTRMIYLSATVLTAGSAVVLVAGLLLGWLGGWGIALLVSNVLLGLGLPLAHRYATRAGHSRRRHQMAVALVVGAVATLAAVGWMPWWVGLLTLVASGSTVLASIYTVTEETTHNG